MVHGELVIAGLLVTVAGLSALARYLSVPYPVVLVVGGPLFGFGPGLPEVKLDPEVVLAVFLPAPCLRRVNLRELQRVSGRARVPRWPARPPGTTAGKLEKP